MSLHQYFTYANTVGYTEEQLDELNHQADMALVAHLAASLYDDDNGTIDIDGWRVENPDEYEAMMEAVLRDYDTERSAAPMYHVTITAVVSGRIQATSARAAQGIMINALWSLDGLDNLVSELDVDIRSEDATPYNA